MKPNHHLFARTLALAVLALSFSLAQPARAAGWTNTGSLNTARENHTATLLPTGKVLVTGGANNNSGVYVFPSSAELYDPASGSWTTSGSLNTPRENHTATLLSNGKVLVVAGTRFTAGSWVDLSSAELYDPVNGTWAPSGSLHTARYSHTATLLPNGKVLVAGGWNSANSNPTNSAELYDPASGTWTTTGALHTERYYHTATLLANGKVLVVGGVDDSGNPSTSAELYDPGSGTWTTTGSLTTERQWHTATLLPTGKVLAVGGMDANADTLASAELYDPANGTWSTTGSLSTGRQFHTATLLPNGQLLP
jgi:N-acetylneuraminic acid mutarotase